MGETISLDDYTTLPGKSGATHSISLCIAVRSWAWTSTIMSEMSSFDLFHVRSRHSTSFTRASNRGLERHEENRRSAARRRRGDRRRMPYNVLARGNVVLIVLFVAPGFLRRTRGMARIHCRGDRVFSKQGILGASSPYAYIVIA